MLPPPFWVSQLRAVSSDTEHWTGVSASERRSGRRQYRQVDRDAPPRKGKHAEEGHDLGVIKGLAALSLDALSSVAYGPEAIMLALVAAGTGALSAIHPLAHHLLLVSLGGLLVLTVVNMFGISESARLLVVPGAIFLICIFATIVLGAVDWHTPHVGSSLGPFKPTEALGVVLILK